MLLLYLDCGVKGSTGPVIVVEAISAINISSALWNIILIPVTTLEMVQEISLFEGRPWSLVQRSAL